MEPMVSNLRLHQDWLNVPLGTAPLGSWTFCPLRQLDILCSEGQLSEPSDHPHRRSPRESLCPSCIRTTSPSAAGLGRQWGLHQTL